MYLPPSACGHPLHSWHGASFAGRTNWASEAGSSTSGRDLLGRPRGGRNRRDLSGHGSWAASDVAARVGRRVWWRGSWPPEPGPGCAYQRPCRREEGWDGSWFLGPGRPGTTGAYLWHTTNNSRARRLVVVCVWLYTVVQVSNSVLP